MEKHKTLFFFKKVRILQYLEGIMNLNSFKKIERNEY